jgi:hypothetical protein
MHALLLPLRHSTGFNANRARPASARPDWGRLEDDHDYFCRTLAELFQSLGYQVLSTRVYRVPSDEGARECAFVLQRAHSRSVALGLRQDLIVTSDVVGRLGRALSAAQAATGLLITTSLFSDAAREAARRWFILLVDRHQLWELLQSSQ